MSDSDDSVMKRFGNDTSWAGIEEFIGYVVRMEFSEVDNPTIYRWVGVLKSVLISEQPSGVTVKVKIGDQEDTFHYIGDGIDDDSLTMTRYR